MTGVGVTESTEYFVVATNECRAGMNSGRVVDESSIELDAEFGHGIGLVNVGAGEELGADITENLLGGGEDASVLLATSGDIKQAEQYSLGANPYGVVEIPGDPVAYEDGRDVGAIDLGENCGDRFDGGYGLGVAGMK